MSVIILVRHCQSLHNAGESDYFDSDITKRGMFQMEEAALHVKEVMKPYKDRRWNGRVSPYLRTCRTAGPISKVLDIPMIVDARIGEVPDEYQKELRKDLIPLRSEFPYDWTRFPKEGICIKDRTIEEYKNDLKSFAKELDDGYFVVVSHLTTIKDLTEILTSRDLTGRDVPNCSVTLVEDGELMFMGRR